MISRIKKSFTNVPASLQEAVACLYEIGKKQVEINAKKKEAKEKIKAINDSLESEITPLFIARDTFFNALFSFAMRNKQDFTKETRSRKTQSGVFGFRFTPPSVVLREDLNDDDIIALLKSKGMTKYVRIKEELDRDALLLDKPMITGITYEGRDEFFAKPVLPKDSGRSQELSVTVTIDGE